MSVPQLDNKFFPAFADWVCGAWSGTKFFVLANYGDVLISPSGVEGTWSQIAPTVSTINMWLNGAAAAGDVCVAVSNGFDGVSLTTPDAGATWFNGVLPLKSWTSVTTDGAGKWVAVSEDGGGNVVVTSTNNGATWASGAGLSNAHAWQSIIWTGTKFVTGANDGYISTSTNGTVWSAPIQITAAGSIKNLFYDPAISRLYANVGAGSAEIHYSDDDGATWASVTPPFESFDNAAGLYKDGLIIIRSLAPNTAYTNDIAVAFDTGNNPLDFNPSAMLYGNVGGVPTAVGIARFADKYIYGTGFQGTPDDTFFHFTF